VVYLSITQTFLSNAVQLLRITGEQAGTVRVPSHKMVACYITRVKMNVQQNNMIDTWFRQTRQVTAGQRGGGTAAFKDSSSQINDVLLRLNGNGYGTTGFRFKCIG
jgi:hypothetical protein